jgi:thiamine-phosphate pyrophosphorylase
MFVLKNKYFLIIENTKDIELSNIKIRDKFNIIYRNNSKLENIKKLSNFRKICKRKRIEFYVSNDKKLATLLKADGLYISANNKDLTLSYLKNTNYKIIGSAHSIKEINIKILQGCKSIIYSRLFKTSYLHKKDFLGVVKFNLINVRLQYLIPMGGIKMSNLNKLKSVNCKALVILSEVKKKPAIISRLF